jgi:hypothetical protein
MLRRANPTNTYIQRQKTKRSGSGRQWVDEFSGIVDIPSPDLKKRMVNLIEKNVALRERRPSSIAAQSIRNARTLGAQVVRFLESGTDFYGILAVDPAPARSRFRDIASVLAVSHSEAAIAALREPMLLCLEEGGLESRARAMCRLMRGEAPSRSLSGTLLAQRCE